MDLLYAQARVYDRVKNWNRLNFLFSIIVPLLLSFVTLYNRSREFVDSELLSSLLGLYGLLVLTFNIVISGHISALRRKAASIQEMYDCRVLGIRRNELKVEEIPRDDIIREAAYFRDSPEKARKRFGEEGWYVSKGVVCGRGRNPTLRLWPAIFSGEIDVFPSERRNMGQEIGR